MLLQELSRIVGPEAVGVGLLLLVAVIFNWPCLSTGPKDGVEIKVPNLSPPKTIGSSIPYIGHFMGYVRNGHSYFASLCASTKLAVFSINMFQVKISIVQPSLTKELTRVKHLSPNPLVLWLFRRTLNLGEHSAAILREEDATSREFSTQLSRFFRQEFIPDRGLNKYVGDLDPYLQREIALLEGSGSLDIQRWVFDSLVGGLGKTFWGGYEGPFGDPEFIHHLRNYLLNIQRLNNPLKFTIDKKLLESRRYVRERLERFSFEEYSEKCVRTTDSASGEGFLARVRRLCLDHGAPTEGWTDYQLLLIAGLGPNVMAAATWMIHHIVADEQRQATIQHEIDQLIASSDGPVDVSRISDACPLLQATWYEVLRYHGGFSLGRYVHSDTTLGGEHLLKKGTLVLAPLKPHHYSHETWGPSAQEFHPERFLNSDGTIDEIQRRNIRVYGLFGTLCPGRFLAVHLAMSLVVRLFRAFDVMPPSRPYTPPEERKEDLAGLPTPASEVHFGLRKRGIPEEEIRICFKSIQPQ